MTSKTGTRTKTASKPRVVKDASAENGKKTGDGSKKGVHHYTVRLVGISPMLQNRLTDETLEALIRPGASKSPPKTDVPYRDMAQEKLHLGPNGEFGIPEAYMFSCLVEAGRSVVYEKRTKISTLETTLLPSFLSFEAPVMNSDGGFFPFLNQKEEWVVDKRRGVNRTTKGATGILRPKFLNWAVDVTVEVDLDEIAIEKVKDLFRIGGRKCGLGDFRPTCRGQFGRFKVDSFVELEQVLDEAA